MKHKEPKDVNIKCQKCHMYLDMCLCSVIKTNPLNKYKTKVTLIMHIKEWIKLSNTGKIIPLSYPNNEVILRGELQSKNIEHYHPSSDYENLILFPNGGNILTKEYLQQFSKPINLIVPDGTWSQASKIIRKNPNLISLPKVRLSNVQKSNIYIRKHPEKSHVSTIEAIAEALSIIEDNSIKSSLLKIFEVMMIKLYKRKGIKRTPFSIEEKNILHLLNKM